MKKLILLLGFALIMGACNTKEKSDIVHTDGLYTVTMKMEKGFYCPNPQIHAWVTESMGLNTEIRYKDNQIDDFFTPLKGNIYEQEPVKIDSFGKIGSVYSFYTSDYIFKENHLLDSTDICIHYKKALFVIDEHKKKLKKEIKRKAIENIKVNKGNGWIERIDEICKIINQ